MSFLLPSAVGTAASPAVPRRTAVLHHSHICGYSNKKEAAHLLFSHMHLLLPEVHLTGLGVHAVHDSERLELIAQIADNTAALLETLLHGNADALAPYRRPVPR